LNQKEVKDNQKKKKKKKKKKMKHSLNKEGHNESDNHLAETRMQEQLKIDKLQSLLDKILSQLEEEKEKFKSKKSTFAFTERALSSLPIKIVR